MSVVSIFKYINNLLSDVEDETDDDFSEISFTTIERKTKSKSAKTGCVNDKIRKKYSICKQKKYFSKSLIFSKKNLISFAKALSKIDKSPRKKFYLPTWTEIFHPWSDSQILVKRLISYQCLPIQNTTLPPFPNFSQKSLPNFANEIKLNPIETLTILAEKKIVIPKRFKSKIKIAVVEEILVKGVFNSYFIGEIQTISLVNSYIQTIKTQKFHQGFLLRIFSKISEIINEKLPCLGFIGALEMDNAKFCHTKILFSRQTAAYTPSNSFFPELISIHSYLNKHNPLEIIPDNSHSHNNIIPIINVSLISADQNQVHDSIEVENIGERYPNNDFESLSAFSFSNSSLKKKLSLELKNREMELRNSLENCQLQVNKTSITNKNTTSHFDQKLLNSLTDITFEKYQKYAKKLNQIIRFPFLVAIQNRKKHFEFPKSDLNSVFSYRSTPYNEWLLAVFPMGLSKGVNNRLKGISYKFSIYVLEDVNCHKLFLHFHDISANNMTKLQFQKWCTAKCQFNTVEIYNDLAKIVSVNTRSNHSTEDLNILKTIETKFKCLVLLSDRLMDRNYGYCRAIQFIGLSKNLILESLKYFIKDIRGIEIKTS